MNKIIIVLLILSVLGSHAHAQEVIQLCVNVTTGGVTTCVPVGTGNPIPARIN